MLIGLILAVGGCLVWLSGVCFALVHAMFLEAFLKTSKDTLGGTLLRRLEVSMGVMGIGSFLYLVGAVLVLSGY